VLSARENVGRTADTFSSHASYIFRAIGAYRRKPSMPDVVVAGMRATWPYFGRVGGPCLGWTGDNFSMRITGRI